MSRRNGATIRLSAPMARIAVRRAVIRAMMRKMLNSSAAAVRLARKTDDKPVVTLPVKTSAVTKVAATAGTTTFLRNAITTMRDARPSR